MCREGSISGWQTLHCGEKALSETGRTSPLLSAIRQAGPWRLAPSTPNAGWCRGDTRRCLACPVRLAPWAVVVARPLIIHAAANWPGTSRRPAGQELAALAHSF